MASGQFTRVFSWLQTVEEVPFSSEQEPPAKRARRHSTSHPSETSRGESIPEPTMDSSKSHALVLEQPGTPPATASRLDRQQQPKSRGVSPTKRGDLENFKVPSRLYNIEGNRAALDYMSPDIQDLYNLITITTDKGDVILYEVQKDVEKYDWVVLPRYIKTQPTPNAKLAFERLLFIREQADTAAAEGYHEQDWNNFVHTQLLQTVFSSTPAPSGDLPKARVVGAMSATIAANYMPERFPDPMSQFAEFEPTSISVSALSTSVRATDTTSEAREGTGTSEESDGFRVDYVLGIQAPEDTPFQMALTNVIKSEASEQRVSSHINQTLYSPLRSCPIGVSIETNVTAVASQDPIVQLGTWIAAWRTRMKAHRESLFRNYPHLMQDEDSFRDRVPSTLLIDVESHHWRLYYTCDQGTEISILGPIRIGSTDSLVDIYALVAVLENIRDWLEGSFREAISKWFMCHKLQPEVPNEAQSEVQAGGQQGQHQLGEDNTPTGLDG